ncbi:hypothetical protein H6P81_014236 [Aristolochia fimbriata]|uniref:Uncharacterized protein n=1 Tax=Aristolochia fimbriata TaxID=158543 RepID=A0AAV7EH68_ARIFI|nr:hypothetical protein H6P81_014236 [Aristolochia fimbriata]
MAEPAIIGRAVLPDHRRKAAVSGADVGLFAGGTTLADMVFGFYEEGEELPESCRGDAPEAEEAEEEEEEDPETLAERRAFWESQHQLLKTTLYRTTSLESRIRQETEQALRELRSAGPICVCPKPVAGGCRNCLLRDLTERLRNAGYDSAFCKSKWRSSPDIPSGEHRYVDVVDASGKNPVRVVIEVDFRGEFEMARAKPEYNKLVSRLPQVFVGKAERLKNLIKILCGAAKECMKENKMHMGPWRKHKYMQAKWFGNCERMKPPTRPAFPAGVLSERPPRPKASMLTHDLLDKMPTLHCTAVEVV